MLEEEWKRLDKSPGIKLYAPNEAAEPTAYSEWEIVFGDFLRRDHDTHHEGDERKRRREKGYAVLPFQPADDKSDVRQMAQGEL